MNTDLALSFRNSSATLLAAERLAIEQGFGSGFTLEDVAREAGVSLKELTREFPDLQALERAVVFKNVVSSQESMGIPLVMKEELPAVLGNILHMAFDSIDELESRYRIQLLSMAHAGQVLTELVEATCIPIIRLVQSLLQERRPELTLAEVEARSCLFVGMCDQYAHMRWTYFRRLKLASPPERFFYEYRKFAETEFVRAILM